MSSWIPRRTARGWTRVGGSGRRRVAWPNGARCWDPQCTVWPATDSELWRRQRLPRGGICGRISVWLDHPSIAIHEKYDRWILPAGIAPNGSSGGVLNERSGGGDDGGHDHRHEPRAWGALTGLSNVWFLMSMSLLAGLIVAYPISWWLISLGLKHGTTTVRPEGCQSPRIADLSMAERAPSAPAHRHADRTPAADERGLLAAPGVAEHLPGHPMRALAATSSQHHGALVESQVPRRPLWALGADSFVVLAMRVVAAVVFGHVGLEENRV